MVIVKVKKRSRSYPAYALDECVKGVCAIRKELGTGPYDRPSLAMALGSKGLSGAAMRKIASVVQFNLLVRDGKGYRLSHLGERISKPISDEEKQAAICDAFYAPELYSELMASFSKDGQIPERLTNILGRSYGIEDSAASHAARIFLSSGKFAGVISEDGQIVGCQDEDKDKDEEQDGPQEEESNSDITPSNIAVKHRQSAVEYATNNASEQHFHFGLTKGRTAHLTVPTDLSKNDILLIQKQVEFLALQVDIAEAEGIRITAGIIDEDT